MCGGPRCASVEGGGGYGAVEEFESGIKGVSFACELVSKRVEFAPCVRDPVLDFGAVVVVEAEFSAEVFDMCVEWQDLHLVSIDVCVCSVAATPAPAEICKNFRFIWV